MGRLDDAMTDKSAPASEPPATRDIISPNSLVARRPRYFFNVYDGHSSLDQDGVEFPDIYKAQNGAIRLAGFKKVENSGTGLSGNRK